MSELRVLICEDERHIARLIQVNLEHQGYRTHCASDGEEAIAILGAEHFDLAVVDLFMPRVGGYEVLTWIRTHEETVGMRVMLMVPDVAEWEARTDLPHRADMVIAKPFNPSELLR